MYTSLFFIFVKKFKMDKLFLISFFSIFLFGCPPEKIDSPVYDSDYGKGLYILSENSINYYDYKNNVLKENIFQTVNGNSISNLKSLNVNSENMYIVSENTLYSVDINTFLKNWELQSFSDAQECEYAKFNRMYISDQAESEIKVVDINLREVIARVKTGDSVSPSDIVLSWERAFVLNSGRDNFNDYDTTLCAIDVKDGVVAINEFAGNIIVDKNPVSALFNGSIVVLCKGIYDESNLSNNTPSSIHLVGSGSLNVQSSNTLSNVYNANNLLINNSNTKYYITSSSGVYYLSTTSLNHTLVTDKKIPTVLEINRESFANTDTTSIFVDFLYMNDKNNSDYIYKYNVYLDQFVDSFQVNDPVIDLKIYK